MAILKTFMCVFNTRTGSLISGCYTLTISLICLVYYLFRYVGHKLVEDTTEYKGIIYVGFVLYGFMIVSSLVVIPGVQLDKRYLLLPWIYIVILVVLYDTGSIALLTTVHMEKEKTLHMWEIVWVFFYLFRLAANCYGFTCVVSQYQELSDGRGTYDYLYKPHRRPRLRSLSQFDIDTFDLPFGVHLPPYTAEDTSGNSPPRYDEIYPQTEAVTSGQCVNSDYVDIEINPDIHMYDSNCIERDIRCARCHGNSVCHSQCTQTACIHNTARRASRTDDSVSRNVQFLNYLHRTNHESNNIRIHPSRHCYEVTVNVEWI